MSKKYNYKDHFEMLYLRHDYISKNPKMEGKYVKKYAGVVVTTARLMYNKLWPNFNKVGFALDDIIAITNIYMLGYMGIYSLTNNPEEYKKYVAKWRDRNGKGRSPSSAEIENSERNRLINFLRQRLQHCSTICARKARNITVGVDRHGVFAETSESVDTNDINLLSDHKQYGYRKIGQKEFKQIQKNCRNKKMTDKDGFEVREVQILNDGITYEDYCHIFKEGLSDNFANPEDHLLKKEKDNAFDLNVLKFNNLQNSAKRRCLIKFIDESADKPRLKKEVDLARKILRNVKKYGMINIDE